MLPPQDIHKPQGATFVVAASDSLHKERADYVCDGVDDQVEIQAAIDALPSGGKIVLSEGNYEKGNAAAISVPSNTEIELLSGATIKLKDGIDADSYIFKNSDPTNGNENIIIKGGKLDCNSQGQSSGVYRAIEFENVMTGTVDTWIENHNHLEYKMKNCGIDFTNRILKRPPLLINECDSLTGFTSHGLGSLALSDDRMSGTKSVQLTSPIGSPGSLYYDLGPPVNLTYRQLSMWIKIDNMDNLDTLQFSFYGGADISPPYVSAITNEPEKVFSSGTWYHLLISNTAFGSMEGTMDDLRTIFTILVRATPKAGTTVVVNVDKIELVSIPPKPVVSIVFDDGFASQLDALPILEKYNAKAGIAVVLNQIGAGGRMTLAELRKLKTAGWDMLSHTMTHSNLTEIGESKQDQELIQAKALLDRMSLGPGADFFIAPYHGVNGDVLKKIKKVYTNVRNVLYSGGSAPAYHMAYDLFFERPQWTLGIDSYTTWTENEVFRKAMVFHDWIVVYGHHIDADMKATLDSLASYCYEQGIEIKTFSEIYNKDQERPALVNASVSDLFMDVLAVSATHIRANEDLSAATPITFTIDAQPDVPRTLSGHFDSHAQITAYTIVITGIDAKGNTVTETFTEAASPWDFETVNAYATITSIIMTARTGTGASDTMDIGITDVLGLSNVIYATGDVFKIKKNNANVAVAAAQVRKNYDTYDMAIIGLAATDDFTIWYKSNLNIIS